MARTFQASELLARARERADMETGDFVDDTEGLKVLSAAYAKFYLLLLRSGLAYFESETTFVGDGTNKDFALPADFLYPVMVHRKVGSNWVPMRRFDVRRQHVLENAQTREAYRWRLVGSKIRLLPIPASGEEYRLIYIPAAEKITSTNQNVDVLHGLGEDYIVLDTARRFLEKEESATGPINAEVRNLEELILEEAEMRGFDSPPTIFQESDDFVDEADYKVNPA